MKPDIERLLKLDRDIQTYDAYRVMRNDRKWPDTAPMVVERDALIAKICKAIANQVVKKAVCESVMTWWEEHKFDVEIHDEDGERNLYEGEPEFVTKAREALAAEATSLRWESDPDPISPIDLVAYSGEVPVGGVKQSGSGRFRWEIVQLPGNSLNRDDRHGWLETEAEAKAKVQAEWNVWRRRSE